MVVVENLVVLISHIVIGLFLGWLSFMIIKGNEIPVPAGILLMISSICIFIFHFYVYFYNHKKSKNKDKKNGIIKERGLSFDPDSPDYDYIGGIGGIGWL